MQHKIRVLLQQIEAELKQLQLWSSQPPSAEALASTIPFCYDTMPLQQWLQFVFLPRFHALLDGGLPLPHKISILPISEETFKSQLVAAQPLLRAIGELDALLSGSH